MSDFLKSSSFVIFKNSFYEEFGGPAEDLENFLLKNEVKSLIVISHPLSQYGKKYSSYTEFNYGVLIKQKIRYRKFSNKFSFLFDLFQFIILKKIDLAICFNSWAIFAGRIMLFFQKTKFIVWYVDLTPNYNENILIKYVMQFMERVAAISIILRVENNIFAAREREKRSKSFHLREIAIVPIGVNSNLVNFEKTKLGAVEIAFLGNLNERNGALFLDKIMECSINEKKNWIFHVIGQGEFLEHLSSKYTNNMSKNILIYGPVTNEIEVNNILSRCAFGLAPYQNISDAFTRFADPGKYTKYLAAGCVIISTEIPLMSKVLEEKAGLIILNHNLPPSHWVGEIALVSKNVTDLENRIKMGNEYVSRLNNDVIFKVLFEQVEKLF